MTYALANCLISSFFRLVSVLSNKLYLSNGKQQDSEEFLTALFTELKWELWDVDDSIFKLFYGKEKIVRKFCILLTEIVTGVKKLDVWMMKNF